MANESSLNSPVPVRLRRSYSAPDLQQLGDLPSPNIIEGDDSEDVGAPRGFTVVITMTKEPGKAGRVEVSARRLSDEETEEDSESETESSSSEDDEDDSTETGALLPRLIASVDDDDEQTLSLESNVTDLDELMAEGEDCDLILNPVETNDSALGEQSLGSAPFDCNDVVILSSEHLLEESEVDETDTDESDVSDADDEYEDGHIRARNPDREEYVWTDDEFDQEVEEDAVLKDMLSDDPSLMTSLNREVSELKADILTLNRTFAEDEEEAEEEEEDVPIQNGLWCSIWG